MRQFISPSEPDKKGLITISGKDYRYLKQVLRLKSGDMLSVRLPDGNLQNTTVCQIDENSKRIILQVCDGVQFEGDYSDSITRGTQSSEVEASRSQIEYWLFQFVAKPAKMELIIRQAVECGVKYIVPVAGAYSQKTNIQAMESGKKDRLERIIREARQQSGSPVATEVLPVVSVEKAAEMWKQVTEKNQENGVERAKGIVLYERNEKSQPLHKVFASEETKICAVAVGCEGGISPQELEVLIEGKFVPVHFNVNILRCETASLYGIAAVQSALLENKLWQFKE